MAYNILIFGGTTEGVRAAALLDALGEPYFYSTKTKTKQVIAGQMRVGAMTPEQLEAFIAEHSISLIIDAAHPFAEVLHRMVLSVSARLGVPTIRYERIFPSLEQEGVEVFASYEAMEAYCLGQNYQSILALTGVQTIVKLPKLWNKSCFRILETSKSLDIAKTTGIDLDRIIQAPPTDSVEEILTIARERKVEAILTKESGKSGFYESKVEAAKMLGIPLLVVNRPIFDTYTYSVDSQKKLHQEVLNLRKTALKTETLRNGYTTGSTLTAAAQAAFLALMLKDERTTERVAIACGEEVDFLVYQENITPQSATYVAIKNGGDDSDVTHAHEIGCTITLQDGEGIHFVQGEGVGRVTLPGLQIGVGQPAINPVPRQVITLMLEHLAEMHNYQGAIEVQAFVPKGREIAKKTFNPRVGVVDGISIIGTTGKVMPYSAEAFVDAIKKQLEVAQESQFDGVLATSGLRSEKVVMPLLEGQYTAIHFGNFVGETLALCRKVNIKKIAVGIMLGKAIKLAEGLMDTHSRKATFNKDFILDLASSCHYSEDILEQIKGIHLANELTSIISFTAQEPFYDRVASLCYQHCSTLLGEDDELQMFLLSANHAEVILKTENTIVEL